MVFAVLVAVAEFTEEATVVIVVDKTPPTLFTVVAPVLTIPTSPVMLTSAAKLEAFPTIILLVLRGAPIAEEPTVTSSRLVTLPLESTVILGILALLP